MSYPLFMFWLTIGFLQIPGAAKDNTLDIISRGPLIAMPDGKIIREDDVRIQLDGVFLITADRAVIDSKLKIIQASGNVKIDYETRLGLVEITAREVTYFLDEQRGTVVEVTARFGESFFFSGALLEILNKGERFIIEDGTVTACNQPTPQWELKIKRAHIQREGYAFIKNARFRIKDVPVVLVPYLILPAMQERRSGLLTPDTGRSERNGPFFSQPVYWAPRGDLDFTLTPTYFQKTGLKLDLESRYHIRDDLMGSMNAAFFEDRIIKDLQETPAIPMEDGKPLDAKRYRIKWKHDQNLYNGHFDVRIEAGSDFSVDRDFLRSTEQTRIRDYYYRARYDRDYGANSLVLKVNRLERILARDEEVVQVSQLPEIRFYQPTQAIGGGFYLRNYLYASMFELDDLGVNAQFDNNLTRLGVESEVSRAQGLGRYLQARWGAGLKGAYYDYGAGEPLPDETDLSGAFKGGLFGFIEAVGPRIQRTYKMGNQRLIHYLDATVGLEWGVENEDPFLESVFLDELDIRIDALAKGPRTAWKVNSRFFWGEPGKVKPVLEYEIGQDVNFDDDEPSNTIDTRFRLFNLSGFQANGLFEYNPDSGTLDTLSVYGSVNRGAWRGYGGYVKRLETNDKRESFIGITELQLPDLRSRVKLALDFDIEQGALKSQEFAYGYQGQCLAIYVSYVRSPFDSRGNGNKDFVQVTLSLTNFGDLGTKF